MQPKAQTHRAASRWMFALGVVVVGAGLLWTTRPNQQLALAAPAAGSSAEPAPRLVFVHGLVDGTSSEVALADVDGLSNVGAVHSLAHVNHSRGGVVKGMAVGDGSSQVVLVASEDGPKSTSYRGAIWTLRDGALRRLAGGVETATRPLVTERGTALVVRGIDGPEPSDAEVGKLVLRTDDISIDEIDLISGTARTIYRAPAHQLFLATLTRTNGRQEVLVYGQTAQGNSLFLLEPTTGATRVVQSGMAPFARDFTFNLATTSIAYATLGQPPTDILPARYEIRILDLMGGQERTLRSSLNPHPMPAYLPDGSLGISSDGDHGLAMVSALHGRETLISPKGDGSDVVVASREKWAAVRHTSADPRPPEVILLELSSRRVVSLDLPTDHQVEVLGLVGAGR